MRERCVVDSGTGEVLSELQEGDRIVRAKSIEYYKSLSKRRRGRSFSKVDISEGTLLLKELDPKERSLLFLLQYFVSYDSCLIRKSPGADMSLSDIVERSGYSRRIVCETLNSLIKKNIIYKGKNGRNVQFFMNPWVVQRGSGANKTLFEMFRHYRIRSLGNITWEELANSE